MAALNHRMTNCRQLQPFRRQLEPLTLASISDAFQKPFDLPRCAMEPNSANTHARRKLGSPAELTPAAVMLLLQEVTNAGQKSLQLILTRRAQSLPVHPGEVCFPGGKHEEQDDNLYATAVRETQEEIGIPAWAITPIGSLPTFTTLSGFRIKPFVGSIPAHCTPVPDEREVDCILYLSGAELINSSRFTYQVTLQKRLATLYFFDHPRFPFWGATAAIANQFIEFLLVACADNAN